MSKDVAKVKRKLKVRPWISRGGFLNVWSEAEPETMQEMEKSALFRRWAGDTQEIEVTE